LTEEKRFLQDVLFRLEALSVSVLALEKHAEPQGLKGTRQTDLKQAAQTEIEKDFESLRLRLRDLF